MKAVQVLNKGAVSELGFCYGFFTLFTLKKWLVNSFEYVIIKQLAGVAELADVQDLGSCVERRAGSSPVARTKKTL